MKRIYTLILALSISYVCVNAQTTYFTQNFDSTNSLSTYVSNPPAANKFDASLASGSGTSVGITSNKLQLTRTAGVGGASITRYTSLGMPATSYTIYGIPLSGVFQASFSFNCAASTGSNGTTYFTIGKMSSTDASSVAVPADSISLLKLKFVTDNTTSGNFYIQNIIPGGSSGIAPATGSYSGTQNIIAVFNNTNTSVDYTAPDSTKKTVGSLKVDLYVNNALVIDEGALEQSVSTLAITGFKLNVASNNSISNFDNIVIKDAKIYKPIAVSDPSLVTQQLTSGNFTIGLNDNGGGMISQLSLPGIGNIMGSQSARYGRGGQSAIRSMATTGYYNPTQAGFNETIGTQCIITPQPGKLTIQPRGVTLWKQDAKYDFTQWENIGADGYNNDGGNTDADGIDESALPGKQSDEVSSEFDYYGTYEDYMNKCGITTSAIRHYFEYRFIRNPGNCIAQFNATLPFWKQSLVQTDLSYQYPAGVYAGTDKDMNLMIGAYALRNDTSLWNPQNRYVQDFYGNWQVTSRDSILTGYQNQLRQAFIIAESSDKNSGRAIGMYSPVTDINSNSIIGVNETDGSISYKDNRTNTSYIYENNYVDQIRTMAQFGFNRQTLGMINRSRLTSGVYETYRQEYYIFYGTPQEIMNAIAALDSSLNIPLQPQNVYFSQDFNSSVQTTNYTGSTTDLLDGILVSGTSGAFGSASLIAGKLNLAKINAGNVAIARSTSMGLPSSGVIQFKFDFDCSAVAGSSTNGTPYLALGRNINPTTVNILPDSNSYVKIKFNINNTTSGNFTIQNMVNSVAVNTTTTLSGTNTLVMVFNNTGSTANYTAPDGTTASVAPNKWDLYANNTLLFNDVNVNASSQALTGFKLSLTSGNTNINLDNMVISDAPNGSSLMSFTRKAVGATVVNTELNSCTFDVFQSRPNTIQYKIFSKVEQTTELSLINLNGKLLSNKTVQLVSGSNTGVLSTGQLNSGLYLVRFTDANKHVVLKKVMVYSN